MQVYARDERRLRREEGPSWKWRSSKRNGRGEVNRTRRAVKMQSIYWLSAQGGGVIKKASDNNRNRHLDPFYRPLNTILVYQVLSSWAVRGTHHQYLIAV